MPKTKRNGKGIFDIAFEKTLFDNAHLHFDDLLQDPELKAKFKEFCEFYHRKMIEKWFPKRRRSSV
ncbi:MAG: hypothetical protein A2W23_00030 [Planctomycetes bacterium RBG_16_43_13]|nr:MAG: hypothetical protein A2W23_00030 [Planctomycetes bacterium RBG_16_43_13]